ncbi:unnamed protein product [Rhodiola kirilowii]
MEQSGGDGAEQSDGDGDGDGDDDDDGSVRRTEQCGGRSGAQTEHEVDSILGWSSARKRKLVGVWWKSGSFEQFGDLGIGFSTKERNGVGEVVWSQIPNSEDAEFDEAGVSKKSDGNGVESLDYEVIENYAYREEQAKRGRLYVGYYVGVKWFFALLIGVATGFAAVFINISVENFAGWNLLVRVYCHAFRTSCRQDRAIPEIKGYLNGVDAHGILLFRTLIGKIFGSIGSVGGGLALGKEGPLVHTGACIASLLGQGGSTKYHLSSRWGVATSGGSQLMWRVFFTSAIVAVVVRTAMGWCKNGNCGHFGSGGFIIWDISGAQEDYSFAELLPMAVIVVIGGLLGALFNQLTLYITYWRRNSLHKKGNRVKIIEACIISVLTSSISFGLPLLRSCTPCPDSAPDSGIECPRAPGMYGNYVNFYCSKEREYNDLATIFFNTQVMFYTLAVVTFGTAVPAGQFYALLGAASFLGGSMRMTVSLCVIMVEITNNLKLLPLIMLVLLISKAVGDVFNEGLYEEQAKLKAFPLLESRPKYQMRHLTAKKLVAIRGYSS